MKLIKPKVRTIINNLYKTYKHFKFESEEFRKAYEFVIEQTLDIMQKRFEGFPCLPLKIDIQIQIMDENLQLEFKEGQYEDSKTFQANMFSLSLSLIINNETLKVIPNFSLYPSYNYDGFDSNYIYIELGLRSNINKYPTVFNDFSINYNNINQIDLIRATEVNVLKDHIIDFCIAWFYQNNMSFREHVSLEPKEKHLIGNRILTDSVINEILIENFKENRFVRPNIILRNLGIWLAKRLKNKGLIINLYNEFYSQHLIISVFKQYNKEYSM